MLHLVSEQRFLNDFRLWGVSLLRNLVGIDWLLAIMLLMIMDGAKW